MEKDIARFRRAVGDQVKADQNLILGNGKMSQMFLRHENVWGLKIFFDQDLQPNNLYSVNAQTGVVDFVDAPDNEVEITATFNFSAYSDAEITELVTEYGVDSAIIIALEELLANASKRRDYKQADSEVKDSQIFSNIKDILAYYLTKSGSSVTSGKRIHEQYKVKRTQSPDLSRLI